MLIGFVLVLKFWVLMVAFWGLSLCLLHCYTLLVVVDSLNELYVIGLYFDNTYIVLFYKHINWVDTIFVYTYPVNWSIAYILLTRILGIIINDARKDNILIYKLNIQQINPMTLMFWIALKRIKTLIWVHTSSWKTEDFGDTIINLLNMR